MIKNLERVSVIVLFLFSMFGVLMFGNIIHEYSHKLDMEGIAYDDKFCFLEMPGNSSIKEIFSSSVAHYSFKYAPENETAVEEIGKFTESKAYTYNAIITIFFLACFCIVFYYRLMQKEVSEKNVGIYHSPIKDSAFDSSVNLKEFSKTKLI